MSVPSALDSASSWLTWSNVVYVGGAVLTLAAAFHVLFEKRSFAAGKPARGFLVSEVTVIVAAAVCLLGTSGAIHFGNVVSRLKDDDLAAYKAAAGIRIAELTKDADTANQKAEDARLRAEQISQENAKLQLDLSKEKNAARKAEGALAKENRQTNQFTHALAVQQQTMAQQIHASPELNDNQVDAIASTLKPFAGQEVIMHRTADTVVGRLGSSIAHAFAKADIRFPSYTIDMDSLYQGVSVVVHANEGHPPLADALVNALRQQGIIVNTVALDKIPSDKVALYLGPQ